MLRLSNVFCHALSSSCNRGAQLRPQLEVWRKSRQQWSDVCPTFALRKQRCEQGTLSPRRQHQNSSNVSAVPCFPSPAQDLLEFVSHYHCLLDLINLVTCLYRLAKMSKEASRARSSYLTELQKHPTFQLLLRKCPASYIAAVG